MSCFLGVGLSCFLGDGLLGDLGDLFGEGVEVLFGVLVVDLLGSIQDGCRRISSKVTVGCLRGYFIVSGLSLALLSVLPLGVLTPKKRRSDDFINVWFGVWAEE